MTQQTTTKTITLGYGLFALVLFAALLIGLVSGGLAGSHIAVRGSGRSLPGADRGQANTAARAWLGITYVPLTQAVARQHNLTVNAGALVVAITANGPAAHSGLLEGDIITAVDQRTIVDSVGAADIIMNDIKGKKPGDTLQVTILRDGAEQSLAIVLGQLPQRSPQPDSRTPLQRLYSYLLRQFGAQ
jgi:S1-C subfamily serine protease